MSSSGSQKKGLKLDHSVLGIYHQEVPWGWVGEWLGMEEKGWVGVKDYEGMEGNFLIFFTNCPLLIPYKSRLSFFTFMDITISLVFLFTIFLISEAKLISHDYMPYYYW